LDVVSSFLCSCGDEDSLRRSRYTGWNGLTFELPDIPASESTWL
jgi:hypothetical protein